MMYIFKTWPKVRAFKRTLSHVRAMHTDKTARGISNYMRFEVLFQREKANFHILVMKIRENSYKVTSTGVLWLETSQRHLKRHSFMFQTL